MYLALGSLEAMNQPFQMLPVRRVQEDLESPADRNLWPATIPAVRQILDDGLDLSQLTILVGQNGAGKSTLVEAIAEAFGLNVEGGTQNSRHQRYANDSALGEHLQLVRGAGASGAGVFLRAETMHGHFAYLEDLDREDQKKRGLHNRQSHGESSIEFFTSRSAVNGLWVFDEAESALSFEGSLTLLSHISDLLATGSQVVLSTHSPILASLPGADIYEVGEWGLRRSTYDELDMVRNWRLFLDAPGRYLRHFND